MGRNRVVSMRSDDGVEKKERFIVHPMQNWA